MSDAHELRRLESPAVRTAWLFQAIIAGPAFFFLGIESFMNIYLSFYTNLYPALKALSLALIAAFIVFIVIVQRNYSEPHAKITARFELSKGILATGAWAWVLLDAAFYTGNCPYHRVPPDPEDDSCREYRRSRIIFTTVSVVILLVFFYPTMFWSARLAREAEKDGGALGQEDGLEATEEEPLLRV